MIDAEKAGLKVELASGNIFCELNHGKGVQPPVAVNYIAIPFGRDGKEEREVVIPICRECEQEINNPDTEWVLLYCIDCCSSQWIYKPFARLSYQNRKMAKDHQIIWLSGCPKCGGQFNGAWFKDYR